LNKLSCRGPQLHVSYTMSYACVLDGTKCGGLPAKLRWVADMREKASTTATIVTILEIACAILLNRLYFLKLIGNHTERQPHSISTVNEHK
jgi:hypothetical protein